MFEGLKDKISQYFSNNVRLLQLNAVDKGSKVLGFASFGVVLLLLLLLILLFVGMGMGEFYGTWFNSRGWGYMAAAGTMMILLAILIGLKKTITRWLVNVFIDVLTNDEEATNATTTEKENLQ